MLDRFTSYQAKGSSNRISITQNKIDTFSFLSEGGKRNILDPFANLYIVISGLIFALSHLPKVASSRLPQGSGAQETTFGGIIGPPVKGIKLIKGKEVMP